MEQSVKENEDDNSKNSESDDFSNTGQERKNTSKTLSKSEMKSFPSKGKKSLIYSKIESSSEHKKKKEKETQHLIDELGLESADLLTDEKKIEEFIVLRAIKDTNLPKFHDTDTIIFESICQDIFKTPMKAKNSHSTLKSLIESVLEGKGFQVTEEIVSRIMYLYQTITMRHGIMVVGATLSGKTTTISILEETLRRSRVGK